MRYSVAQFRNGAYVGVVTPRLTGTLTQDHARMIAGRWVTTHQGNGWPGEPDYRAVGFNLLGYPTWQDAAPGP